jgi:hypothetical protein
VKTSGEKSSECPNSLKSERREGKKPLGDWNVSTPLFFVSVASKGVRYGVSLLFATLAERSISVIAKGLRSEKRLNV